MSEKEEEELPEQCKSCYWYWWIGQPPKYYCKIKSGLTANELPVPCPDYGMKEEEQQQKKIQQKTKKKLYVIFEIPLTTTGVFDSRSFEKQFKEPTLSTRRNTIHKFIVTDSPILLDMNREKMNEITQRLLCDFEGWVINYKAHALPSCPRYFEGYWDQVMDHFLKKYKILSVDDFMLQYKQHILSKLVIER
ncbi:MAG TPA: hypothetical protein VMX55_14790 [candidate division Zixibacteria bacterium]|nr:hypothetical protein [candidate division Zixibacteria bacterium]